MAHKPRTTAELFCGIGGFRLACDHAKIRTVWANDLDPLACRVYRDRFGAQNLREGDLTDCWSEIPDHDLLTAGFPCQPFSSAGKKRGVADPRGTLFQVIVEVVKAKRPEFFVLENVKRLLTMERGYHFATILASLAELDYLIEWRLLNAMHLGLPQNRQRVVIVGVRQDSGPTAYLRPHLATRDDLSEVNELTIVRLERAAPWTRIEKHGARFATWGMAESGRFMAADLTDFSDASPTVPISEVLQPDAPAEFDFTDTTSRRISDNTPVNRFVQGVEILSNQGGGARMGYTIFGIQGVAPTLTSTTSRHYERYRVGNRYRRLTNVEYARIQGFPDDHCSSIAVYEQYRLFGNAIPPPLAQYAVETLTRVGPLPSELAKRRPQLPLFGTHATS